VLGKFLFQTFRKPELEPSWIEFRNKLNNVKHTDIRYDNDSGCRKSLIGSMGGDFPSLKLGHTQRQLPSRVSGPSFVKTVAQLEDITTSMGPIHTEPLR